jgi:hypothetical protein
LDVELTEQCDGFFSIQTNVHGVRRINGFTIDRFRIELDGPLEMDSNGGGVVAKHLLRMNRQYAANTPEPHIMSSHEDTPDPVLSKGRRTHNARLDCDIEVGLPDGRLGIGLEHFCDGEKFGMACAL